MSDTFSLCPMCRDDKIVAVEYECIDCKKRFSSEEVKRIWDTSKAKIFAKYKIVITSGKYARIQTKKKLSFVEVCPHCSSEDIKEILFVCRTCREVFNVPVVKFIN